jgi:hypothetical protein
MARFAQPIFESRSVTKTNVSVCPTNAANFCRSRSRRRRWLSSGLEPALVARALDLVAGDLVVEVGLRGEDRRERRDPGLELGIVAVVRPGQAHGPEGALAGGQRKRAKRAGLAARGTLRLGSGPCGLERGTLECGTMTLARFGRAVPEIAKRLAPVGEKHRGRADARFLGQERRSLHERVVEALDAEEARQPRRGGAVGAHDAPRTRAS